LDLKKNDISIFILKDKSVLKYQKFFAVKHFSKGKSVDMNINIFIIVIRTPNKKKERRGKMESSVIAEERRKMNERKEMILHKAKEYAREEKQLTQYYYVAYAASKKIPERDREDVVQEIVLALIKKKAKQEEVMYLIAKEKVVQYYRRGRIEDRNYKNILMARYYYHQNPRTRQIFTISKYKEDDEETFSFDLVEDFDEEVILDKIIIESFPKTIRKIIEKRLQGYSLQDNERAQLSYYLRKHKEMYLV